MHDECFLPACRPFPVYLRPSSNRPQLSSCCFSGSTCHVYGTSHPKGSPRSCVDRHKVVSRVGAGVRFIHNRRDWMAGGTARGPSLRRSIFSLQSAFALETYIGVVVCGWRSSTVLHSSPTAIVFPTSYPSRKLYLLCVLCAAGFTNTCRRYCFLRHCRKWGDFESALGARDGYAGAGDVGGKGDGYSATFGDILALCREDLPLIMLAFVALLLAATSQVGQRVMGRKYCGGVLVQSLLWLLLLLTSTSSPWRTRDL